MQWLYDVDFVAAFAANQQTLGSTALMNAFAGAKRKIASTSGITRAARRWFHREKKKNARKDLSFLMGRGLAILARRPAL